MIKNLFIAILAALCCLLGAGLFLQIENEGNALPGLDSSFLSHPELIKAASIHGLSLETPVEQLDAIIAQTQFQCRTSERENVDKEGQTTQYKTWECAHKTLKRSQLQVQVANNQIQKITRSGYSKRAENEVVLAQLDLLKMRMSTLEGFNMNQNDRSTTFQIRHRKEDNRITSMSFRMQFMKTNDPENPPKNEGTLNVVLLR